MDSKPLEEQENIGTRTITFPEVGTVSTDVEISRQFDYVCNKFYEYLKKTNRDIKVWQNVDGDCLLVVGDKAVVCHINIISECPRTDLDEFYMGLFRWYRKFFSTHYYVNYVPAKKHPLELNNEKTVE